MKDRKQKEKKNYDHGKYIGKTNIPDYGVPSGVQLTEKLNEEIAEAAQKKTPELLPER
ncbi:hypothetical protein Tfer_2422 [Thermincola ferriacetica]|uniref:Uncharacterized protein n=1 Tax=Thermincola ferriacetica TaxID=281456 RepID=A0A0L6W0N1_9FIRM|nr:hypothetical protein [Thermincola ferriacetica]KNZ68933.1 hypothetical protein Tfer_2422 [Thermincola ferriacetica]